MADFLRFRVAYACGMNDSESAPYRFRWIAFAAVLAASVMDLLDSTVASVAAPAIREDLGGSYASLQWIAAGYTLAMAVMLLTGGRLGDLFGRRRALLVGIAGFVVASIGCAVAQSPEMLIVARVLQGGIGAVMVPQGFGLIRQLFPPQEMAKAFMVFGPVMGLSAVVGPLLAGVLVDADILGSGWRMIFLINVPIGIAAFMVGAKYIPEDEATESGRLDLTGVALAGAGMFGIVYALVQGRELGWPASIKALLAGSVIVLGAFAVQQLKRKRAGRTPLVEPSVFAKRSYSSGILFATVFCGVMGGMFLIPGVLLQVGLHYDPLQASVAMIAIPLGAFVGSALSGMLMAKLGRLILHAGLALIVVGLAGMHAVLDRYGVEVGGWELAVPFAFYGVGMGAIFVPLYDIILADVEQHEVGSASGVLQATQQLGMSLGIAVIGTVYFGIVGDSTDPAAFIDAAQTTTVIVGALAVVGFAIGFLLPRHAHPQQGPAELPAGVEPALA
jgi:EmrB/QacA subfamily drug resistance transporter